MFGILKKKIGLKLSAMQIMDHLGVGFGPPMVDIIWVSYDPTT